MSVLSIRKIFLISFVLLAVAFGSGPVFAQDVPPDTQDNKPPVAAKTEAQTKPAPAKEQSSGESMQQMLKQMQAQLDAQNKQIEKLQTQYASEVGSRQKEIEKQDKQIADQTKQIGTQREAIQSLQKQVDQSEAMAGKTVTDSEKALRSRLETVETSIKTSQEADSTSYDLKSFPGSIPIPGSSAAIKLGGFVKMNVVQSFNPIGTEDRFIVGSIPVPQTSGATNTALTVAQSRLNVDLRDMTQYGAVRAFLEADFAGAGDTFRLRHAFGQYKSFLIGKHWTTFMDSRLRPEDLDFEGINGEIRLRQAQVRYFPSIAKNWHLLVSAEDPDPNIEGGKGISKLPDLVASIERTWFDKWHVKTSLLLRKIAGECYCDGNREDSARGWALSVSGKATVTRWDERDNMAIQMSYGEGYSHYVNDLGSVNAADAIFNPLTGKLETVPVFAAYITFQKWWSPTMRSNVNYGYVNAKGKPYFPPSAYKSTYRFIVNYIWSPIARIDLGAEFLIGARTNINGDSANAKQVQLSAKYRY